LIFRLRPRLHPLAGTLALSLNNEFFGEVEGDVDPFAYVVSANIHRRHLTTRQKHDIIATSDEWKRAASERCALAAVDVPNRREEREEQLTPDLEVRLLHLLEWAIGAKGA
jgi:hypothetical protein